MTFQPYKEEAEELNRQSELPLKLLKQGTKLAGYALGGGSILSRILPLLNKFIPADIAKKGLSKVDPRMGKFVRTAEKSGSSFDEIRRFITDKIQPGIEEEEEIQTQKEKSRIASIGKLNERKRRPSSELSRGDLQAQFEQGQQGGQGKSALLQTMQEITQALRNMRENG
jgi:hypothetical protein